MSMAWIREQYHVPAKRGGQIRFAGGLATITGTQGPHLRARMVEDCRWANAGDRVTLHPTWEVRYLGTAATEPTS